MGIPPEAKTLLPEKEDILWRDAFGGWLQERVVKTIFECEPACLTSEALDLLRNSVEEIGTPCAPESPRVSVWILTYNQKGLIEAALNSVLEQEIDEPWEIVVGDDGSTDGTRELIREWQERHPQRIRLVLAKRNLWNALPGYRGTLLATAAFYACRGNYVAMLEGDDFWTDSGKLRKQVAFLEKHSGCSGCFHRTEIVDYSGASLRPFPLTQIKPFYSLEDVIRAMPAHTSSLMLRREAIENLPAWYQTQGAGDWTLQIAAAEMGELGFIDETMSAYRVHDGGSWTKGNDPEAPPPEADVGRLHHILEYYETLNRHFDGRFDRLIRRQMSTWTYDLVWAHQRLGQWPEMRAAFWRAFCLDPMNVSVSRGTQLRFFLVAHFPQLYRLYRRGRKRSVRAPQGG